MGARDRSEATASAPGLAVITGAASGMGLATALKLIERGTKVIGVDLADAPSRLQSDGVLWLKGDVADEETWNHVLTTCLELDPLGADCLIACAGEVVVAPFLETSIDEWRRLLDINLFGVIRGMQILMPAMIRRGQGAIAVVCSVNSLFVEDQLSAYSVSKAGLLHLVRAAALEHSHNGLRINAVCPGIVDTPMLERALRSLGDPEAARRSAERRSPIGRLIRAQEVADTLCFLVSSDSSGLSGAALIVDGGLTTAYDFDSAGQIPL